MSQRYFIFTKNIPLLNLKNSGQKNLTVTNTAHMERLILVEY